MLVNLLFVPQVLQLQRLWQSPWVLDHSTMSDSSGFHLSVDFQSPSQNSSQVLEVLSPKHRWSSVFVFGLS